MSEETITLKPDSVSMLEGSVEISVAELEKLGFTRTVVKPWKPVKGEACYYLDGSGIEYSVSWLDNYFDIDCWDMGNCYQTEVEAIEARDKQLATMRVLRRLRELEGGWVADWSDSTQSKYHPCYDCNSNSAVVLSKHSIISASPAWYSTEEVWEQVIEELESDVKRMMGVG